jgi:hypothetical protein
LSKARRGRDEQEEKPCGSAVNGTVRNAGGMAAENENRMIHEADEGVPRVGKGDAIANASAVELFAVLQGAQERFAGLRLARDLFDLADEFRKHFVAPIAGKVQVDGFRRKHFAENDASSVIHRRHLKEVAGELKENVSFMMENWLACCQKNGSSSRFSHSFS